MANRTSVRTSQTLRIVVDSPANVIPVTYTPPSAFEIIAVTLINRAAVGHTATLSNTGVAVASLVAAATNGAVVPATLIASAPPNTQNYVAAGSLISVISTDATARFELLVTILPGVTSTS